MSGDNSDNFQNQSQDEEQFEDNNEGQSGDENEDDDDDSQTDDNNTSEGPKYVRLRGLPWSATHKEILDFLVNINVVDGAKGIHLVTSRWDGKNTGEAYVEIQSQSDVDEALKLNRALMGHRYIEVFSANSKEAKEALRKTGSHGVSYVVKLRGLPYSVTEQQIEEFFSGLEIKPDREGILFVMDRRGRATGEAFVQFESQEDTETALGRNREKIGHRYIEIFRSSSAEMKRSCNGGGRPGPYDLKERGSNRSGGNSDYGGGRNNNNMRGNDFGFGMGANNSLGFGNLPNFTNSGNFGNGFNGNGGFSGNGGGGGGGFGNNGNFGNDGGFGGNNRFNNGGNFGNDFGDFGNFGNNRSFGNSGNFGNGNGNNGGNFGNNGNFGGNNGGGNFGGGNNGNFGNNGGGGGNNGNFGGNNGGGIFGGNNGGNFGGNNGGGNFGNNGGGNFGNNGGNFGGGFSGNMSSGGGGNFGPIGGGRSDAAESYVIHMRGLPYTSFDNDVFKFFDPVRPSNVRIHFNQKGMHSGTADAYFDTHDDAQTAMKRHREQMGNRYIELFYDGKTKMGNTHAGPVGGNNFSRRI